MKGELMIYGVLFVISILVLILGNWLASRYFYCVVTSNLLKEFEELSGNKTGWQYMRLQANLQLFWIVMLALAEIILIIRTACPG